MGIRVLSPEVAAKIAAGEVVERPASVVKELVENSLDAGASLITVEVMGGGTELIRVSDDGCGIPAEDVELAFRRHATSKISSETDLESISTMGFRGEALPSIAAVSRVSVVTRPAGAAAGREIHLVWGEPVKAGTAGSPPGTSIAIEGLFENVPARRKFLKVPSGETSRISDLLSRYALAFPEIGFRLLLDGRSALTSPGTGLLADALVSVYGGETAGSMLEVPDEGAQVGYSTRGFISAPSLHRANRSYITFLVNRRWVQSPLLSFALSQSYQGFLPERRHPMAVLNLTLPTDEVDVNVHPAKREVRFRQEDRAFSTLQRAIRATLVESSPVPEMRLSGPQPTERPFFNGPMAPASSGSRYQRDIPMEPGTYRPSTQPMEAMSSLRILGQARGMYLVAEGPDGLYLIDQHAAHERVLFDQVLREVAGNVPQAQALLDPVTVELSPGQEELVQASGDLMDRYGFILEPFGERAYLLRAVPTTVGDRDPAKALLEVLDLMAYEGLLKEREEAMAASVACHGAVRAGMSLGQREMEDLVRQLQSCDSPHTCPHGRPTMIHLSLHHLEREFGRK